MECNWIEPFVIEKYRFNGAFSFFNDSQYSYLLSKTGRSIIIDSELLTLLKTQSISEEFAMKLLSHGLIQAENIEHCNASECNALENFRPSVFVIDITKSCNLNCIYCFRDLSNRKTIGWEKLKDICEYIDRSATDLNLQSISIQLWGGEPLCALDRIRFVSDFFAGKSYAVKLDIETNATLVTPQIAKELYNRRITVGVSVDGYPQIQNYQRPLLNGNLSSDAVRNGVKNLLSVYGNRVGGICVVTKYNYRFVAELLDYYVNELDLHSVKFNLVRDNPNALDQSIGLTIEETKEFCENLIKTLKIYRILGVEFSEGNILTKYQNLIEGHTGNCCISQGCTGGIRILSFDMNGDIFPCEMTDYPNVKIGNIYTGDDLVSLIKKAHNKNSYYRTRKKEECDTCPWWFFCKGGCSSRVHYIDQIERVDETECILNKTIYPELIEHILNNEIGMMIS